MWKLIGRRLMLTIPLLLIVSVMVFGLAQLIPGDPAITLAGETATPERIEEIRQKLGQDKPLITQYVDMMTGIAQGDLGTSLYSTQKVTSALATAIPATLSLSIVALLFLVLVGVPFGILAGTRPGSILDRTLSGIAALGVAAPAYWVGMILLIVFALRLGWFPTTQYVPMSAGLGKWFHHLVAPGLRPVIGRHRGGHPAVAIRNARGDAPRLHPHSPSQGTPRPGCDLQTCSEISHQPGDHRDRSASELAPRRSDRRGVGL
jgi:peptide/nickel transport system permease protein